MLVTGCLAALGLRALGIDAATAVAIAVAYGLFSLLVMVVVSKKYGCIVHCLTFCPLGLVVSLLGRTSPWRVRVDTATYDNCGVCEKVCKYNAITQESRVWGGTFMRCSLCRDCLAVCHSKALSIRCPGLNPAPAWAVFAGLTTVLHVIFFSAAMV